MVKNGGSSSISLIGWVSYLVHDQVDYGDYGPFIHGSHQAADLLAHVRLFQTGDTPQNFSQTVIPGIDGQSPVLIRKVPQSCGINFMHFEEGVSRHIVLDSAINQGTPWPQMNG